MKFDLHLHTSRYSSDSLMPVLAMLDRARQLGLEGLVITEHDWLWTEAELDELRAVAPQLVLYSGIEVSAREGHFLAYGVHNPFAVPAGMGVADLCREVHAQGGAVVAAHPFRWGQDFDEVLARERPDLDGLELLSSTMDAAARRQASELQARLNLAGLGSSDAHRLESLGLGFTEFPHPIRDLRDLIEAVRSRQGTACLQVVEDHPG
jgi:predicted metal-dependent phosphoesterase TrpH